MNAVSRVRAVGVVTLILAASGCGSAKMTAETTRPVNSAHNVNASPAQRAAADATGNLASFRPPAGAVKERARPAGVPAVLDQPIVSLDPDVVTRTGWWTVKGTPGSVRSWLSANPPRGLTVQGSSTADMRGRIESWTTDFVAPPVPGVLPSRELVVTVAALGADRTVIKVDAQDAWLPARPSSERIPAASLLTARATYGLHVIRGPDGSPAVRVPANDPAARPPAHVPAAGSTSPFVTTVTDGAKIARIAALIDALPVVQPGPRNCPMDNGSSIALTFRSSATGPVVAEVTVGATGCRGVSVTVHGKPQPELDGGMANLVQQIKSVLGVNWPGLT